MKDTHAMGLNQVSLQARHISLSYGSTEVLRDISLAIEPGEFFALLGPSGSGKSTIARAVLGLLPIAGGEVILDGEDRTSHKSRQTVSYRRRVQMVFQDPYSSLNPRMTVAQTLAEPLRVHNSVPRHAVGARVAELMALVGMDPAAVGRYPHAFSGGQRQRIAIGRALATRPEFIVADEPVSALDVTIQAQILDLLADLTKEYGLTMLFISHDLAVIRQIADRIAVMYHGKLVEEGPTAQVFDSPSADYTRALLAAIPGAHAA